MCRNRTQLGLANRFGNEHPAHLDFQDSKHACRATAPSFCGLASDSVASADNERSCLPNLLLPLTHPRVGNRGFFASRRLRMFDWIME